MSDGLGCAINAAFAAGDPLAPLASFAGEKIACLAVESDALTLTFDSGRAVVVRDDGQSCCEERSMTCDDDLAYHAGATFLGAEIAEAPNIDDPNGEDHEVQFLRIKTSLGIVTVANHNRHNGYYGGFWVEAKVVEAEQPR